MSGIDLMDAIGTARLLGFLVGVLLPIAVGYVTKSSWTGSTKAVTLAAASGLTGFFTEWLNSLNSNTTYDWRSGLLTALAAWVIAVATHFGYWKPVGMADYVGQRGIKD